MTRVLSYGSALLCMLLCSAYGTISAQAAAHGAVPAFQNVRVSHDAFAAHSEPAIAENPANHQNLIAGSKFFSDPARYRFKIGTFYSQDGGRHWHDNGLLPGFDDFAITSDISMAFSRSGIAYVCVLAASGKRSGVFVSRSVDGGKTWSKPATVFLDTTGGTFSDKPWIAVDQTSTSSAGTVYVAWNLDGAADNRDGASPDAAPQKHGAIGAVKPGIVLSRSTDKGNTFSAPVLIHDFTAGDAIGAIPAVGPLGQVYVAYIVFGGANQEADQIRVARSTDGGQTFAEATVASIRGIPNHLSGSTFRSLSLPAFAVSRNGSMVTTWAQQDARNSDIFASSSVDGNSWTVPARVNHDHLNNGKDHFQPVVAVAANGTYTCAWFDRRHDPQNRLIDEEIAQSTDNGHTFGHNFRVTARSWDPSIGAPLPEGKSTNTFIGDYQALAVDNSTVHPLWNDTQNGRSQQIRTSVLPESRLR